METTIVFPAHHDAVDEKNTKSIRPFSLYNSSSESKREVIMIVAMSKDNSIGKNGEIPWHLPEDLQHFKKLTMGHPVIMGRKTWESLPFKPLKGRRNMVVSRNPEYEAPGAEIFTSVEEAIAACVSDEAPFIIGGEQIYKIAMPFATRLIITEVDVKITDADAFFPVIEEGMWQLTDSSDALQSKSGLEYCIKQYDWK